MAVIELNTSVNVYLMLDNGTSTTGEQRYVYACIGPTDVNRIDNEKYLAIKNALAPLMTKQTLGVKKVITSTLDEE